MGSPGDAVIMRYREDKPADLDRARAAVTEWRKQNPAGTADQLTAALGPQFHPRYGPVLRAVLFTHDRHHPPPPAPATKGSTRHDHRPRPPSPADVTPALHVPCPRPARTAHPPAC